MKTYYKILIIALLSGSLSACGILKPANIPEENVYNISTGKTAKSYKQAKTQSTLLVFPPVASPGYQTNHMIYVKTPYQLQHYANNRWIAPPAKMMLNKIEQSLSQKNYFKAVVTAPFPGKTNYQLQLQLVNFEQSFIQPMSMSKIVIHATLVNTSNGKIIASKSFKSVKPAPQNNAYSGVMAMNQAAREIANNITDFAIYYSYRSKG